MCICNSFYRGLCASAPQLNYPTLGYCNATATVPDIPWCPSTQPDYSAYR